jgi:hypothetical protein
MIPGTMGLGDNIMPGLAQRRMHKEEAARADFISEFVLLVAFAASLICCGRTQYR